VLELVRRQPPAAVIVSGDMTQRARSSQFREARAFVDALAAPVAWVPGNHDVPLWRFWERLFAPFGAWRRDFDDATVRDRVGDGVAILGVNTAHAWTTKHGRLRPADLADLEARLAALPEGIARVVVAHHPVAAGPELGSEPVARRGLDLLRIARRHRVDVVLCGHLHRSFAISPERSLAGGGPLVLHCGTTLSSRGRGVERGANSLNWIEIDERAVTVERRMWNPGEARFLAVERGGFPRAAPV
jgi:3',5'-cyclic AMP phosphodiesterase CpdA